MFVRVMGGFSNAEIVILEGKLTRKPDRDIRAMSKKRPTKDTYVAG